MLQTTIVGMTGTGVIGAVTDVVFAASILLFAFGLSPDASVVDRKPLGVTAMFMVALWPLAASVVTRTLNSQASADDSVWSTYGYFSLLVPASAGLVAAAQIARSANIPSPWRWAPLWVLGAYALTWAVSQIMFVTVRPEEIQALAVLLATLSALASLAGTLGLGILAIALAAQQRAAGVEVYRSA